MRLTPTGMFGFLRFAQITKNSLKKAINYATYLLVEFLHWQRYRPLLNHFRTETLKLPPLPYLGRMYQESLYCMDLVRTSSQDPVTDLHGCI
ncbi:MAG: hypothetical protein V7L20_14555 [Nostoc sp.]|uniref:hypothetical protein n=1 Tax=Nostoc sp. TaxID=1180 RepID=UPI002FF5E47D